MRAKPVNADEQYRLIMECRASGLTDYQWCIEHGIKPGTFYNWVKRLRQKGCDSIPSAVKSRAPVRQEIVKIDLQKPSGSILEIEATSEPVSRSCKLYPLSRTFLKIEIPIFRHLILEDTLYSRHPQMPLTHDFGHFDYGTHYYSYLGFAQTHPRREAGKAAVCFPACSGQSASLRQGLPGR